MPSRKKSSSAAITTVAARQHFSDLINRVAYGKDRVLLTRRNRPLVAVVPIEDIALLEEIEDREDLNAAQLGAENHAGDLFVARPGVPGLVSDRFKTL